MINKRLILEASNIHLGGGYILLQQLMTQLEVENQKTIVFLDSRLEGTIKCHSNLEINFVKATLIGRLKHYLSLPKILRLDDTLFCFGNIPPFGSSSGCRSIVFLQNWFLICNWRKVKANNIAVYIRLLVERFLLRIFSKNISLLIVQSESMKRQVQNQLPDLRVLVQPFFSMPVIQKNESSDFYFYPARGDKSKNHLNLVNGWIELSKKGVRPRLVITIDSCVNPDLTCWIDEMIEKYALNIENIGFVDVSTIRTLYSQSPVIIFPSYFESFGLPLVEANALGLVVIAPELDYVRDVCIPEETFDPHSATSIARAVFRHHRLYSDIKCGSAADIVNTLFFKGTYSDKN
jgi:glycosyltransferase involved in cell wall biosynthesis